jgi:ABC-type multidrug transport system fused ATPase/permease subunit
MPNKTIYEGGDDFKDADVDAPPKSKQDKMNDKYGDKVKDYSVDPKMADGPVKERGCTDVICLGVFIIFLVGMFSVTSYCFAEGDVSKYLAPVDKNSNICGYGDNKGKDYLHFDDLASPWDSAVCVDKCSTCYRSVFKYCFPNQSKDAACATIQAEISGFESSFKTMLESNAAGKQVMDIYKSSRAIYTSIALAIVLCFAYIYLMSYFAEQIAWTIIGITQVSLFLGTGACFFEYFEKHSSTSKVVAEAANGFLVGGIVLGLAAIIMLIMLVCGFNQLKIAIDVVDASADFIRKTKRVIGVPVIYFFLQVIAVLITMFAFVCVWSIGDIASKDSSVTNSSHQLKTVTFKKGTADDMYYIAATMFFGLLWIVQFFNAQQSFIVMVSATSYYFDSNSEKDGYADVGMGVKFAWVNHIGSLAMGSFIIAVVEFLRVVVATIVEQATKASGNNPVVKCIGCVANCCMECL